MPHPLLPDLETLASSVAAAQGFELCGIQMLTHMSPMTLEVQIRHSTGTDVSLDDCAGFSGVLGDALETSTLLTEAYVLEISSPGIGDQLIEDRDFQTFRGFPVEVIHRDKDDSEQRLDGLLLERSDDELQINIRGRIKRISRDRVIGVRLTSPSA
ncbi:MAG: ribosome maturation factor RimP [Synechococcus sp. BS301-5m-G54]|uniref:ribosome maturation factor RimP n=1 Tax=Synechococcales TaxID=1890424 RepID=UPI0005B897A6|nr:ribosome maturation factor RimP [Synechococcus sp. KORDI-49]MBL6739060.1 ribosome maturation factor RimP [Synechococcus sp. BS301-5m-G54]MBL6796126.1 ribosome maturation factor RimP [Synechococcus sp. BS307-5m-G34]OUW66473.1 MAG: ribosome assembly cofactor RimP [Synechococcus sp. TMED205]RCL51799.1 MAG: ribosome assembly cofactor RimP [Synechococcus sp. MED-G70]HCX54223.1 ribosome assembly cofactor RimP [Synechococcus sp. UBA9887]